MRRKEKKRKKGEKNEDFINNEEGLEKSSPFSFYGVGDGPPFAGGAPGGGPPTPGPCHPPGNFFLVLAPGPGHPFGAGVGGSGGGTPAAPPGVGAPAGAAGPAGAAPLAAAGTYLPCLQPLAVNLASAKAIK